MGALRRLQAEQDEHMKTARHIALLAEWTKDGHPLLSPDAVGPGFIVLAMRACTDRSATHLDRHRRVRRLKELLPPSAHKADVELLRRLAGHFNSLALGLPGEPEIVDRVVAAARRENAGLPSDVVFHPAGDR